MPAMMVLLNGKLVPEKEAVVSVSDRSFLYGDGLFETMRVRRGKIFAWKEHWERLKQGAEFLKIKIPYSADDLAAQAGELIAANGLNEAILRLTLSRGVGLRGYSPKGADAPIVVMTLHPLAATGDGEPSRWRVITAGQRLPAGERLANFKTCNKLAQILARAEAEERDADEALLLNSDGFVVEGAASNLFYIIQGVVATPSLQEGVLAGVTRALVLKLCDRLEIARREANLSLAELQKCEGAFLSLSSLGLIEIGEINDQPLRHSPITKQLIKEYAKAMEDEHHVDLE